MMVFVVRPYGAPLPLPLPLPLWPIRSPPGNTLRSLRDWRSADLTDVVQKIKSRSSAGIFTSDGHKSNASDLFIYFSHVDGHVGQDDK